MERFAIRDGVGWEVDGGLSSRHGSYIGVQTAAEGTCEFGGSAMLWGLEMAWRWGVRGGGGGGGGGGVRNDGQYMSAWGELWSMSSW